jgi:hypothetical protein
MVSLILLLQLGFLSLPRFAAAEQNLGSRPRISDADDREPSPQPIQVPLVLESSPTQPVFFGLTPNPVVDEPLTFEVMTNRLQQTIDAGVTYLVGVDNWAEIEVKPNNYSLYNVNQLAAISTDKSLQIYYTLRLFNGSSRDVPSDLQRVRWMDPRMRARVLRLIEAVAPVLKDHAKWFTFGYEVDSYFARHPGEAAEFAQLYRLAAARMKELVPGIQVSSTFTFAGLHQLDGALAGLRSDMDFLAVTYCPVNADFTVEQPDVLPRDFALLRQRAEGQKIVFQELAYPSSHDAGSSEDKQAEFYETAFRELGRTPGAFEAVNFMMLADLSEAAASRFADSYGLNGYGAFKALIQTLGMFDGKGRPKKAWTVFVDAIGR